MRSLSRRLHARDAGCASAPLGLPPELVLNSLHIRQRCSSKRPGSRGSGPIWYQEGRGNRPVMVQSTIMDNGIRVVTESVPHVESVALGFWIGSGA